MLDGDLKIRDEFAFDIHGTSPNDERVTKAEMSEILGEMISRLAVTLEEALRESLGRALAGVAPGFFDNQTPDSTTTDETRPMLRIWDAGTSRAATRALPTGGPKTPKARIALAIQAVKNGVRRLIEQEPLTLIREYPVQWKRPRKTQVELATPTDGDSGEI